MARRSERRIERDGWGALRASLTGEIEQCLAGEVGLGRHGAVVVVAEMSVTATMQVPSPALISAWLGGHTALGSGTKFVVLLIAPPGENPPPAEVPTTSDSL